MAIKPGDSLQLGLGLDTDGFEQGAKKVDKSLAEIQKALAQSKAALAGFQAELAQTRNVAVQAGQSLDKSISDDFRKKISASRTEVAKLNAELAKSQASGSGPGAGTGGIGAGIAAGIGSITSALAGLGVAYAAFTKAISVINLADSLGDIADATGQTSGALLSLKDSLISAGGEARDFEKLATKFAVSVGDAANGNEKLIDTFKKLQVPIKDSSGAMRDQDAILQDAIKALAAIENPAERAAIAVDLFGKSAAKLDFTKLSAAKDIVAEEDIARINALRAELEKLGNFIDRYLISIFGSLAESINKAFSQEDKIKRLGDAIAQMEAKASKKGGLGFADTQSLELWKKQLAEVTDAANKANEARLRASAGARGGSGAGYETSAIKDSQYGTKKADKAKDPAANLFGDVEAQSKRDLLVLQRAYDEFKALYDKNLVSLDEYYKGQAEIINRQSQVEQEAFEKRKVLLEAEAKNTTLSEKEQAKAKEALAKADQANADYQYQQSQKLLKTEQDRLAALEKYKAGIQEINLALLERQNLADSEEAQLIRMEQIAAKYAAQMNQALLMGDEVAQQAIQRMVVMQQSASNIAAIASKMQRELGGNTVAQAQATMEGSTGQSTQLETQQKLNALKQEEINLRIRNLEAQKAEAEIGGDTKTTEELAVQIDLLKIKLEELKPRLADLGVVMRDTFQQGLGNALTSIIDGTKSVGNAFKDLGRTILQSIANAAVKNAVAGLFGAFGGGVGTSLSQAAYAGISGFANGGHVKGPGTGTSDSIPARLSNGEFVVRANAVKMFGLENLKAINNIDRGAIPNSNRLSNFAGGGMVSAPTSAASAPVAINIQNTGQPKDAQATTMMTPEGMVISVVMKDIQNNGPITQGINAQSRIRR